MRPVQRSQVLANALYTAAVAPIVLGLLNLSRKAFSFRQPRRRLRTS